MKKKELHHAIITEMVKNFILSYFVCTDKNTDDDDDDDDDT